jgi:hypothetical protein
LTRTDAELDTIAIEAYKTAKAAYAMKPGEAPRFTNPDTCRWRCGFTEPCLLSRKKGQHPNEVMPDFGFVRDETRH